MSGIYFHIPFCKQACYYCDFHFSTSLKKKESMLKALKKELQMRSGEAHGEKINTIYFGGGTPSLLTPGELYDLIGEVYMHFTVSEDPEITLEANPDDLDRQKIIELSRTPVNRLSIGIQSFFDSELQAMNRAHNAREADECIYVSREYFNNLTIDLIYGIPEMNMDRWNANIQKAIDLKVPHISSYALTVEPGTAWNAFVKRGTYPPLNDQLTRGHFYLLTSELERAGYIQYEISNFGKPNYFSRHNTAYWTGEKYLGIGPSAHSFNGKQRSWNVANNSRYIRAIDSGKIPMEIETLSAEDRYNEYIMTGLRTIWGVSLNKIETDFGIDRKEDLLKASQKFVEKGLLALEQKKTSSVLKITSKGKFLADGISSDLFLVN